jgi:hypothetical protein
MYSWQNQVFRFIVLLIAYMVVVVSIFLPQQEHWRELIVNPYIIFCVVGLPALLVYRIFAANREEGGYSLREKLEKFDILQKQDDEWRNKTPLKRDKRTEFFAG